MMKGRFKLESRGDREIVISRSFDAPPQLVFEKNLDTARTPPQMVGSQKFKPNHMRSRPSSGRAVAFCHAHHGRWKSTSFERCLSRDRASRAAGLYRMLQRCQALAVRNGSPPSASNQMTTGRKLRIPCSTDRQKPATVISMQEWKAE